jgi:hypothetical protein
MTALRAVPKAPADQPVDITLALRAEIDARDWARVHIAGDRRAPVSLAEHVRRIWRG